MATPRQNIINALAVKVANINFEAWRFEQGDPIENDSFEFAKENNINYIPQKVDQSRMNNLVEGYVCAFKSGSERSYPKEYAYYMDQTDKQYFRMVNAIEKEAEKQLKIKIDLYDMQKLTKEHKAQQEKKEVSESPKYKPEIEIVLQDLRDRLNFEEEQKEQSAPKSSQRIFHAGRANLIKDILESITKNHVFFS